MQTSDVPAVSSARHASRGPPTAVSSPPLSFPQAHPTTHSPTRLFLPPLSHLSFLSIEVGSRRRDAVTALLRRRCCDGGSGWYDIAATDAGDAPATPCCELVLRRRLRLLWRRHAATAPPCCEPVLRRRLNCCDGNSSCSGDVATARPCYEAVLRRPVTCCEAVPR